MAEIQKESIGIYGGTFSPPHLGHYLAARAFLEAVQPDKLLIMPTFLPPHKTISASDDPTHRLEMAKRCFASLERTEVSDLEILRRGKSYTYDTLTALSREGRTIYFLCGTDMLLTFDRWYRFEDIFSLCTLVLARREQDEALDPLVEEKLRLYREHYHANVLEIRFTPLPLSSTEVRNAIASGASREALRSMLQEDVIDYILSNGLYRPADTL